MGHSVQRRGRQALAALAVLVACDGGAGPSTPVCNTAGGQAVTMAVGAYQTIPPLANAGCFTFPGNASLTETTQYLLAPQIATDSAGTSALFLLDGDTLHPAVSAAAGAAASRAGLGVAERFHDLLREEERTHWARLPRAPRMAGPLGATRFPPPTVGSSRTFSVRSDIDNPVFTLVTATAKTVTGHLAIYVDNAAPANGLSQADLDSIGALFDARLYAIDTTAFGRESDIDANTVVAVLITNVVNRLVTRQQCAQSGFIAGFFFGFDIDPLFAGDPRSNHGEVFYSMVADPDSTLSCAHSVSQLKRLVPVTFVHEFQHMISYNEHVLVGGGDPQDVWLDEGMSHFAEELAGRSFLPGDTATFSNYLIGDLFNAYSYLNASGSHFLAFSSGIGSLAERGAAWLFVRYVVDQFAADTTFAATAAFTRTLGQSNLLGGAAVEAVTGTPFATIAARWMLANYVSDLPGFTAPPELRYSSWRFRTTFASLNQQRPTVFPKPFPLTPPTSAGNAVGLSGFLRAGSGPYAIAQQPPSTPGFTLLFSGPNGTELPNALDPRLNVIRIR
ncbi:MAG: hypothetical protein ACREMF_01470 [Gemmatimonadales bacterium]